VAPPPYASVQLVVVFVNFSDYFPVIQGFSLAIHIRIHHDFSSFFWVLAGGPRAVGSGPLLSKFTTLAQTFCYATDYSCV